MTSLYGGSVTCLPLSSLIEVGESDGSSAREF